jgi:hypothetical protein
MIRISFCAIRLAHKPSWARGDSFRFVRPLRGRTQNETIRAPRAGVRATRQTHHKTKRVRSERDKLWISGNGQDRMGPTRQKNGQQPQGPTDFLSPVRTAPGGSPRKPDPAVGRDVGPRGPRAIVSGVTPPLPPRTPRGRTSAALPGLANPRLPRALWATSADMAIGPASPPARRPRFSHEDRTPPAIRSQAL